MLLIVVVYIIVFLVIQRSFAPILCTFYYNGFLLLHAFIVCVLLCSAVHNFLYAYCLYFLCM